MTEFEKKEIAEIVANAIQNHNTACPIGVPDETARELIAFAEVIKECKKTTRFVVLSTIVAGCLAALWMGLKFVVKQ